MSPVANRDNSIGIQRGSFHPSVYWLSALLHLVWVHSGRAQDIIQEVRRGNNSSLAALVTVNAHVHLLITRLKGTAPIQSPAELEGEYHRSGAKVRIDEKKGFPLPNTIWIDYNQRRTWSLSRPSPQLPLSGGISALACEPSFIDAWNNVCLSLPDSDQSLGQILASSLAPDKVRSEGNLIYIDVTDRKGNRYEAWADRSVNYLVRRVVCRRARLPGMTANVRIEVEVQSFEEVKPGVFFPKRSKKKLIGNDEEIALWETTLSNLRINEPLPDSLLQASFPEGTVVTDQIRGVSYRVNADGQPTGLTAAQFTEPAPISGQQSGGEATPLDAERSRWPVWTTVAAASCVLLLVGTILKWRKQRRSAGGE